MSIPFDHFYHLLPKAELHVHLEGAISAADLYSLAQKYSHAPVSLSAIQEKLHFTCFKSFLTAWSWKNQYLRAYEDFEFIARRFAEGQEAQNIVYTELFYSPSDFRAHGLSVGGITEAIRSGLAKVPSVQVRLIADLVRDNGAKEAERLLHEMDEVKASGVVGIGLGGSEDQYAARDFGSVFKLANQMGFELTVHAGEACGPDSIREAVNLGVSRIGHGIRCCEDSALMSLLIKRDITLEVCPSSNLLTQATGYTAEDYPLAQLIREGLSCTINTDDPAMFNTSLAQELALCESGFCEHGLNKSLHVPRRQIIGLVKNAFSKSWMAPDEKRRYLIRVNEFLQKQTLGAV